jgi:hypothetical protein
MGPGVRRVGGRPFHVRSRLAGQVCERIEGQDVYDGRKKPSSSNVTDAKQLPNQTGRSSFSPPPPVAFGASFTLGIWHIRPLGRQSLVGMTLHVASLFTGSLHLSLWIDLLQPVGHMLRSKRGFDVSPRT